MAEDLAAGSPSVSILSSLGGCSSLMTETSFAAGNIFHPQDHVTRWEGSESGSMYILEVVLAASIPLISVLFAESSDPNGEADLWFPGWAFHQQRHLLWASR